MTPTDQTSTLLDILGGSLPITKHSGGKYLRQENNKTGTGFYTLFFFPTFELELI